jgi:hypothetical protein
MFNFWCFPKDDCFILVLFKWLEKINAGDQRFFFIVDQKLSQKHYSVQVASRFLIVTASVSYCNICRKYSDFADQKSLMFIGKIVHRMDTHPCPNLNWNFQ